MTTTAHSDAELLAQARQGDEAAFTELYVRHHSAAKRVASAYPRAGDPDDLVNGAFERVLGALRRGAGPNEAFRAYLFVTLRRFATEQINRQHDEPVDEVPEPVRAEERARSAELDATDRQLVVSAYESLPERWQAVLWQTAVEGRQPRELAGVLGMSANAAAALAYRAREKLRQAYLQAHLQTTPRPQCEPHRSRLGAYVRDGLSRRDQDATDAHLDDCGSCRGLVAELVDVNRLLVRSLFPIFQATGLGAAAVGAAAGTGVAGGGGGGGGGGVALLGRKLASKARTNPVVVAGAVVAAAALAVALVASRDGGEQALPPGPGAGSGPATEAEESADPPSPSIEPAAPTPSDATTSEDLQQPSTTVANPAEPGPGPASPAPESPVPPSTPPGSEPGPTPSSPSAPPTTDAPAPPPNEPSPPPQEPPPAQPPAEPALFVVWLGNNDILRITLTNNTGRSTNGVLLEVDTDGGALIPGRPSGCGLSLTLIWSTTCAVLPLDPGETAVVDVPVRVTGPGQAATTQACESSLLGLACLGDTIGRVTTALLG